MDAPQRGALMLVRFIAAALIGWAIVNLALYFAINWHEHKAMQIVPCLVKALPLVAGLVILFKARALAAWIADQLEG